MTGGDDKLNEQRQKLVCPLILSCVDQDGWNAGTLKQNNLINYSIQLIQFNSNKYSNAV